MYFRRCSDIFGNFGGVSTSERHLKLLDLGRHLRRLESELHCRVGKSVPNDAYDVEVVPRPFVVEAERELH